ncbi:ABC transporter substrate-binding protein [Thermanaerothrix sp. 4228-RoL]|uniref:ABC transporter substrate-binding protein n=1 Tax=Thermanaerothrix solaris TaxID=3058434 RepID=A0ABU3NK70_9CHLR|nr:ABC transporter substrate-binding protein [Thermanaerothrix sp. 4228-RoL]MDT8896725.1 ABC transporter substrate-binding protein [Thermanaerothrix sp. 4228-RoL]
MKHVSNHCRRSGSWKFLSFIAVSLFTFLLTACQNGTFQIVQGAAPPELLRTYTNDCSYGGLIKSIEALDLSTVRITLCRPDAALPAKLAYPVFAIQDSDYLNHYKGNSLELSRVPNASGPYRLLRYDPGQQIILERNPDYWGVPPKSQKITINWYESVISRIVLLRNGQTDAIDSLGANFLPTLETFTDISPIYQSALNVTYLGFNNRMPPFNDVRVRTGIALSLNRPRLLAYGLASDSILANQFLPPAMNLGYTPGLNWLDYSPKEAQDWLKQANFDWNQELVLVYPSNPSLDAPYVEMLAQQIKLQLNSLGLKVKLLALDSAAYSQVLRNGNAPLFLATWSATYADPDDFFSRVFIHEATSLGDPYPELTGLIQQAAQTSDPQERQKLYDQINETIIKLVPAIPIAHTNGIFAFRNTIQGQRIGPINENYEEMRSVNGQIRITQTREPASLWPADESDPNTLRVTRLLYSNLVEYEPGGTNIRPGLAEAWEANPEATEWTFYLRSGVRFVDGSTLDANDVVATLSAMWEESNPNHVGRSGRFEIFQRFFGAFIPQAQH